MGYPCGIAPPPVKVHPDFTLKNRRPASQLLLVPLWPKAAKKIWPLRASATPSCPCSSCAPSHDDWFRREQLPRLAVITCQVTYKRVSRARIVDAAYCKHANTKRRAVYIAYQSLAPSADVHSHASSSFAPSASGVVPTSTHAITTTLR